MSNTDVFTTIINGYLPEPHASLLNGIVFGLPISSDLSFYDDVKVTGLLHIVVLSGTNITLLAAMVGAVTVFLPKWLSLIVTMSVIIAFVWFVGPAPPVIRAAIMGVLAHLAVLFRRSSIPLIMLILSALITAFFWPTWISTVSFQLSYGATLGLILIKSPKRFASSPIFSEFWPSIAASSFTVPIIFLYFREISLVAPLANLAVSFLIGPLMLVGFAVAILGKIHFILGLVPSYIAYVILSYMIFMIRTISSIPYIFLRF